MGLTLFDEVSVHAHTVCLSIYPSLGTIKNIRVKVESYEGMGSCCMGAVSSN